MLSLDTLGRTDHEEWQFRDSAELRQHAEEWRDVSTLEEQDRIFTSYGTRWSEMWCLPYWDPTCQLVLIAMHCILEGVAHHHFRIALGLTNASAVSKPETVQAFSHRFTHVDPGELPLPDNMTTKEAKSLAGIHKLLMAPLAGIGDDGQVIDQSSFNESVDDLSKRLSNRNMKPLHFVALDINCAPPSSRRIYKKHWVKALVERVSSYRLKNISLLTSSIT